MIDKPNHSWTKTDFPNISGIYYCSSVVVASVFLLMITHHHPQMRLVFHWWWDLLWYWIGYDEEDDPSKGLSLLISLFGMVLDC